MALPNRARRLQVVQLLNLASVRILLKSNSRESIRCCSTVARCIAVNQKFPSTRETESLRGLRRFGQTPTTTLFRNVERRVSGNLSRTLPNTAFSQGPRASVRERKPSTNKPSLGRDGLKNSPNWARTSNLPVNSRPLYH